MRINRPNTANVGLFGLLIIGSEIKNIGLLNIDIKGNDYVGGLVGSNYGGSIANSYATGAVNGNEDVGGLVGRNLVGQSDAGSITSSYAVGSVYGYRIVGGLVGENGGSIANSYAAGSVNGDRTVGGLAGQNYGSITDSYAVGSVDGNFDIDGLVGQNHFGGNQYGSITRSYWDTEVSGISTNAAGTGKTTTELQSPTTATGIYSKWSADTWDFGTTSQYPVLKDTNGDLLSPTLRYGLSRLQLTEGNLSPDFVASLPNYTGTVVNSTNMIRLTPTAVNPRCAYSY